MSEDEIMRMARTAVIPWKSADACTRRHKNPRGLGGEYVLDGEGLTKECFNCEKEECDNCHSKTHKDKRAVRMKETREIFLLYYCTGFSKKQICKIMGISDTTYYNYLKMFVTRKD